jgi:hypothetical protein
VAGIRQQAVLVVLVALAAVWVLPHLGRNCLWEDEAQTAVVAKNILSCGVPAAWDGRNLLSIYADHRDVNHGISIWQGWLPSYLAAASMAIFGPNTFGARLPFAVAFIVLVGLFHVFLERWRSGHGCRPWVAEVLLLTCVPLLVHARQCRYYLLVPLFNLLVVEAYLGALKEFRRRHLALLILWLTALVNTFFPGAILLLLALGIDLIRRRPARRMLAAFAIAFGIVVILNLPMAVFCRIWDRQFSGQPGYSSFPVFAMYLLRYVLTLNNYVFPAILVLSAFLLRWRAIRWQEVFGGELTFLFGVICLTQLVGFALISDVPFTRYLIGVVPFILVFGARCLQAVSFNRRWLLWPLVVVVAGTNVFHVVPLPALQKSSLQAAQWNTAGVEQKYLDEGNTVFNFARGEVKALINIPAGLPLVDYLRSLPNPPRGPVDYIVDYLNEHALPSDRVKISYGDLPLMFHTRLRIVNSTEVGEPGPDWMIFRHFSPMRMDQAFLADTAKYDYTRIEIPFPDLQWNNQPDPLYHYFRTPAADRAPAIVLFRKGG